MKADLCVDILATIYSEPIRFINRGLPEIGINK